LKVCIAFRIFEVYGMILAELYQVGGMANNVGTSFLKKSKFLQAVYRLSQERKEEAFLVGGAVRDFLLGRPVGKDFDFVTRGDAEGLAKEVAGEKGGHAFPLDETFGTWRVVLKKKKKKTELDFSRLQGKDIFEDLRQRDFTVNSVAIHLKDLALPGDPCFIDPLDGLKDIRKRILRANSEESLRQDPLRMLRAFRFASTLRFSVEGETLKMIHRNRDLIRRPAGERIRTELFMALGEEGAGLFLRKLQQAGLMGEIFPEVRQWENLDLGTGRPLSLLDHALRTVEAAEFIFIHLGELYPSWLDFLKNHFSQNEEEGVSRKALFKFIAFFHDSGKAATASQDQGKGSPRFLDHDQEGVKINTAIARRLKLSRRSVRIISELTRQHMRIQGLAKVQELTGRAKYRFFQDLGREGLDLAILSLANALASSALELQSPFLPEMSEKANNIRKIIDDLLRFFTEEFTQKFAQPLVNGKEIMGALGLPQGKAVGDLLNKLKEAEISGRVRTKEDALEFLKNIDKSG
jgi:poly(A) polymerase